MNKNVDYQTVVRSEEEKPMSRLFKYSDCLPSILVYSRCKSLITSLTRKTARCFRQHPWESYWRAAQTSSISLFQFNWGREGRSQRDNRVDCSSPTPSTKCRSIRALFTFICVWLIYRPVFLLCLVSWVIVLLRMRIGSSGNFRQG